MSNIFVEKGLGNGVKMLVSSVELVVQDGAVDLHADLSVFDHLEGDLGVPGHDGCDHGRGLVLEAYCSCCPVDGVHGLLEDDPSSWQRLLFPFVFHSCA